MNPKSYIELPKPYNKIYNFETNTEEHENGIFFTYLSNPMNMTEEEIKHDLGENDSIDQFLVKKALDGSIDIIAVERSKYSEMYRYVCATLPIKHEKIINEELSNDEIKYVIRIKNIIERTLFINSETMIMSSAIYDLPSVIALGDILSIIRDKIITRSIMALSEKEHVENVMQHIIDAVTKQCEKVKTEFI